MIKNVDPNKAHEHDMISIRMLRLCGDSVLRPVELIFLPYISQRVKQLLSQNKYLGSPMENKL